MDFICYSALNHIIYGVGATAADAITDARWNARDPDVDTSTWRTAPATASLIDLIHRAGGDCCWQLDRATGTATL